MSFDTSDIVIKIAAYNEKYTAIVDGEKDDNGKWTVTARLPMGKNEKYYITIMGKDGFTGKAIVKIQDANSNDIDDFAEFAIMGSAVEHTTADRTTESHPEGLVSSAGKDSDRMYGRSFVDIYRGIWTHSDQDITFNINPDDNTAPYIHLVVQHKKYKKPSNINVSQTSMDANMLEESGGNQKGKGRPVPHGRKRPSISGDIGTKKMIPLREIHARIDQLEQDLVDVEILRANIDTMSTEEMKNAGDRYAQATEDLIKENKERDEYLVKVRKEYQDAVTTKIVELQELMKSRTGHESLYMMDED